MQGHSFTLTKNSGECCCILECNSTNSYWKRRTKNRGMALTRTCWISHQTDLSLSFLFPKLPSHFFPPSNADTEAETRTRMLFLLVPWMHGQMLTQTQRHNASKNHFDAHKESLNRGSHSAVDHGSGCGHQSEAQRRKYETLWEETVMVPYVCVCVCVE